MQSVDSRQVHTTLQLIICQVSWKLHQNNSNIMQKGVLKGPGGIAAENYHNHHT